MGDKPRRRGRYPLHAQPGVGPSTPGRGGMSAFRSRGPRNGRVLRPDDIFVLRSDITAAGDYPLCEAAREVMAEWAAQAESGQITAGTVETHSKVLTTLVKFAAKRGVNLVRDVTNEILIEWLYAQNAYNAKPVSATTPRARRAVTSAFYYTCFRLGITDVNLGASLPVQGKSERYVHAFSLGEIDLLKEASQFAFRETKSPSALALALLGCAPGEVGSIRVEDIHLAEMLVRAHGGGGRYAERWLPIDDPWCFEQLAARVKLLAGKHPTDWRSRYVAYVPRSGKDDNFGRRSAATSTLLATVIKKAGLRENGVSRVASINEYVAARVFTETGRVEAVAARLGIGKLDDAVKIVGYDWREAFTLPAPGSGETR